MKWAIAQGDNPAGDAIAAALPKRPVRVRHMPALPYREVPAAIAAVHASRGWIGAKLAFEFQVFTAAGSSEVRLATWDEFDLGAMVWTVPDTRMKVQREHRVPLCGRALEILREAERLSPTADTGEPAGLVFPSRCGKTLSAGGGSKLVKILGIAATDLDTLAELAGRVPLAEQVVGRTLCRAGAAGDELNVHRAARLRCWPAAQSRARWRRGGR